MTVADDDAARQRLLAAGAIGLNPIGLGDVFYEAKFRSPEGLVVDVGHWAGTSPIPPKLSTCRRGHRRMSSHARPVRWLGRA